MEDTQHIVLFLVGIWLFITPNRQALFEKRLHASRRKMAKLSHERDNCVIQSVDCSGSTLPFRVEFSYCFYPKQRVIKLGLYGSLFKGTVHKFYIGNHKQLCSKPELNHTAWKYDL